MIQSKNYFFTTCCKQQFFLMFDQFLGEWVIFRQFFHFFVIFFRFFSFFSKFLMKKTFFYVKNVFLIKIFFLSKIVSFFGSVSRHVLRAIFGPFLGHFWSKNRSKIVSFLPPRVRIRSRSEKWGPDFFQYFAGKSGNGVSDRKLGRFLPKTRKLKNRAKIPYQKWQKSKKGVYPAKITFFHPKNRFFDPFLTHFRPIFDHFWPPKTGPKTGPIFDRFLIEKVTDFWVTFFRHFWPFFVVLTKNVFMIKKSIIFLFFSKFLQFF